MQATPSFDPAPGYPRVRVVRSFEELAATPLSDGVNALCWPRILPGNFGEVASALGEITGITSLDEETLADLRLSAAGDAARDCLATDLHRLADLGLDPTIDAIPPQARDPGEDLPTDVYSWHADSATAETDTWLCSYTVAGSEGLRNDEARRRADVAAARNALLQRYGGKDDAGFADYLTEHFHDLHYVASPAARPFAFGLGHLWRIATVWPGCPVPPCIHRAPLIPPGSAPRLLLIS